ncbi:TauD/TfdA family dioxygenase [Lentzea sp. JNUCC 0626]|uniref:TauD/TfdA family dioxygenase n=1 Tax=Lentzea sp. JNUCC 0626 TaxID=3367513 RepID=UPI00374A3B01
MSETARFPVLDAPADSPWEWLSEVAADIAGHLPVHGAVLVHDLPIALPDDLARAREALGVAVHRPTEAFNHRTDFGNGVQAPISWPAERSICCFQECSYSTTFPSVVLTACITPPESGQAHLSDTRRIPDHLPARLVDHVRAKGWAMSRVFHDGFGLSAQDAFFAADRAGLEKSLGALDIDYDWLPGGSLRTTRRRPGVVRHPVTGEECWFNQLVFLNSKSLDPGERLVMANAFGEDLPMDTFFGDGSTLPEEDWTAIYRAYESTTTEVTWRRGDLLITDNVITAQGRSSFEGSHEFLVSLGGEIEGRRIQA